jgi:hypothetical protein
MEKAINKFKLDHHCGFGYLGVIIGVDEKVKAAKNEGIPVLTDWLVQSIHAAVNPDTFKHQIDGKKEAKILWGVPHCNKGACLYA